MTDVLAVAKIYAQRGWFVFPLHGLQPNMQCTCGIVDCKDAGKHPRLRRWQKDATRDPLKIEEWFNAERAAVAGPSNLGVVTGMVSGITVIDIDIGPGKMGAESWATAIAEKGEPDTLMSQTGSGGMHVFFQYNSALKTAANVLGKGVDCRNDGGYVVAPPSRHRSGGEYVWLNPETKPGVLPAHLSQRKENRGRPRGEGGGSGAAGRKGHRMKYTIEQVKSMLNVIPSDDRDTWRSIGIVLGREFGRVDAAWEAYVAWSDKWGGKKSRQHDEIMREAFFEISQQASGSEVSMGTIVKLAMDHGWSPKTGEVPIAHFVFYGPGNNFIYRPTFSYWIEPAVNAAVSPINTDGKLTKASDWLKTNQLATSLTSDPMIEEDYIKGYDCRNGEIIMSDGAALFNSYRKPTIELGDAKLAGPFVDHVRKIFNKANDADQFIDYMAHRVQKPWEKPRFALLIAGGQGVGKDTAVEFCCPAIGSWNVSNIDPSALETNFNEFAASALIRISEAANLQEMSKWAFNERTKVLIAGNPDVVSINPKYGQKFSVRMYCGVIITTNNLISGIYIPPDDRRYDVINAATMTELGWVEDPVAKKEYFDELWAWFNAAGDTHVAAFLHERDISKFSASGGQRKTDAHSIVVAANMLTDTWIDDVLETLGAPDAVRSDWLIAGAISAGEKEMEARRRLPGAIGRAGYVILRNPNVKDGRWKIGLKKVSVYAKPNVETMDAALLGLDREPF